MAFFKRNLQFKGANYSLPPHINPAPLPNIDESNRTSQVAPQARSQASIFNVTCINESCHTYHGPMSHVSGCSASAEQSLHFPVFVFHCLVQWSFAVLWEMIGWVIVFACVSWLVHERHDSCIRGTCFMYEMQDRMHSLEEKVSFFHRALLQKRPDNSPHKLCGDTASMYTVSVPVFASVKWLIRSKSASCGPASAIMCAYACTFICMFMFVCGCVYVCCTYVCIYVYMYDIYTYTHTYRHTQTYEQYITMWYIYIHTHIQTYTNIW